MDAAGRIVQCVKDWGNVLRVTERATITVKVVKEMGAVAYVVEVGNLSVGNVMEPEKGLSLAMSVTEMESVPNAGEGGFGIIPHVLNVGVAAYVKDAKAQERQNLNAETAMARGKSNVSNVRETESARSAKAKESLIAIDVTEPENVHAAMAEDIFAVRIVKA